MLVQERQPAAVDDVPDNGDHERGCVIARSLDRYTTNVPREDVTGGKEWLVHSFDGYALAPDHEGSARLLIAHLYFWKSAKCVAGLRLTTDNEPGLWERVGYHDHGDPWREQRYQGDR
ncbi:molybdopterin-dependent oxidoreductase [[Kitasatospora] papulosa]|uniref:molybdopterin-dependent oxidoreductase n=1 Tax=[Kitasatospora] papulosa TaxID=1464011 RepID=UPI0036879CF7